MQSRIGLVSIPVGDQDRAKYFYVQKLGFKPLMDTRVDEDMRWVMLQPPGGGASVTLVTWFESMPAGSLRGLVLTVEDVEATAAALRDRGISVDPSSIESAPWGRWFMVDDPDGNSLIMQENA